MQIIFNKITLNDFIRARFARLGMLPKPAESPQTSDTHAHAKRARTRGNSAVATVKVKILCNLSNIVPNSY